MRKVFIGIAMTAAIGGFSSSIVPTATAATTEVTVLQLPSPERYVNTDSQ